jgi:hypothetical protein
MSCGRKDWRHTGIARDGNVALARNVNGRSEISNPGRDVILFLPDNSFLEATRISRLTSSLVRGGGIQIGFGLEVAKIAVNNVLPPMSFYLRLMDIAWAVHILRRSAVECKEREIRLPKLYASAGFS